MPTLLEISNNLVKMFVQNPDKKYAAKRIVNQINYLQYCNTQQPIDDELKVVILRVMNEILTGLRPLQLPENEVLHIKSRDVDSFSRLSSEILRGLSVKKKKQDLGSELKMKPSRLSSHSFSFNLHSVGAAYSEIGKYFKTKK